MKITPGARAYYEALDRYEVLHRSLPNFSPRLPEMNGDLAALVSERRQYWQSLAQHFDAGTQVFTTAYLVDPDLLWRLLRIETDQLVACKLYLRDHFGIDLTQPRGADQSWPQDFRHLDNDDNFWFLSLSHDLHWYMGNMLHEMITTPPPGVTSLSEEHKALWVANRVTGLFESFAIHRAWSMVRLLGYPGAQRRGTLLLSGWLHGAIGTRYLQHALRSEGLGLEPTSAVLAALLPGAIILAAHDLPVREATRDRIVRQVAQSIRKLAPEQGKRTSGQNVVPLDETMSDFAAEQEFHAREEASQDQAEAEIEALIVRAALSPRQRQVVDLRRQGLKYHEIAELTGMDANTVGVQYLRARRKMEAAVKAS